MRVAVLNVPNQSLASVRKAWMFTHIHTIWLGNGVYGWMWYVVLPLNGFGLEQCNRLGVLVQRLLRRSVAEGNEVSIIGIMLLSHLREPYGTEFFFPTIAQDNRISLATREPSF